MQQSLVAGDTLSFETTVVGYPASQGWTLTYRLVPRVAGAALSFAATASGDAYRVTVPTGVTATWAPGVYSWVAYITKAGERFTVDSGFLTIQPDSGTAVAPLDLRSQARKALHDLLAARASWVASGGRVRRYSIAGRDIEYKDAAEIDLEIAFWTKQVGEEQTSADLEAGRRPKNRILTRFVRPS
jgi:hypothetical protein